MHDNKIHLCRANLAFATREHLDALAFGSNKQEIKLCQANFPDTTFSDRRFKKSKFSLLGNYKTRDAFLKHVERSKSKAIFLQSPYIDHYPDWFLDLHDSVSLAYSGYSLSLVDYFEGQYGSHLVKNSKYLLAGSHDEYRNYIKYGSKNSIVVLAGNPLMYTLRRRMALNSNTRNENQTLLWAPHWIEKWETNGKGFARWEAAFQSILTFSEKNFDKRVIVRPHPLLRNILDAYLNDNSEILNRESRNAALSDSVKEILPKLKTLLELRNVELSNASMMEDVLFADILITEGVSIIGYWAATGKPILVLRDSLSPNFNVEGQQLLLATEQASDHDDILDWIRRTISLPPTKLNRELIELSQTLHPTFNTSPIDLMAKHM
jgi:hypothetical protein